MKDRIDYAPFYLQAEKKMQEIYEGLKNSKYKESAMLVDDLLAEVRLMQIAIKSYLE